MQNWADMMEEEENALKVQQVEKLGRAIDEGWVQVRNKNKKEKKILEPIKEEEEIKKEEKSEVDETKDKFKNTKLCYSFYNETTCTNEACTYAHSIEDLNLTSCNFGKKCRNILLNADLCYRNNTKSGRICSFIHEDETLENYEKRVISEMKVQSQLRKKKVYEKVPEVKEFPVLQTPTKSWKVPVQVPDAPVKAPLQRVKEVQVKEQVKQQVNEVVQVNKDEKITITIPEGMAIGVLEFLIKSGRTNVEIITK